MRLTSPSPPDGAATPQRFLPVLLVLFVGSGCAALIYEIVWFQMLEMVIGSSAVSLGVLLGTFMGGMCLGSLMLPRLLSVQRHPLRVYAMLELGIGAIALLELLLIPQVGRLYVAGIGQGWPGTLLRGAVCAVCLLPPTVLMGATLPAIARWVETTPLGVSWLGFFYGGNIAGAVFGCLLAGFYLLRIHDAATATCAAAVLNLTVCLLGSGLAKLAPRTTTFPAEAQSAGAGRSGVVVYVAIGLSGLTALGAEVVWTRLLSLMLGPTVYAFAIILAVFLVGLGLGSSFGSLWARRAQQPGLALGTCQLLLVGAVAWTAWMISGSLPFWPVNPFLSTDPWVTFQLDMVRCLWAILPPAVLWGASFPLALAAVASRGQDAGRLVGGLYAANTLGAIAGALGFSLVLIPSLGTRQSQQVMMGLAALAALLLFSLVPVKNPVQTRVAGGEGASRAGRGLLWALGLVIVLGGVMFLIQSVPPLPWGLVAYGRELPQRSTPAKALYVGEGRNASVAVTELDNGIRNFHVSGKVEASNEAQDMRLQRMLGHLPALFHPHPRSVLVVGCGAGVTAGCFVLHPDVQRIVICEIEPLIPQVVAHHFGPENYDVVNDPRVQVIFDDARHYVLTTREKFDIITSDPIHPWVKGAAALYTREYFETVRQHLQPGGLVTQWVPLYESTPAAVKSELATFFGAFPDGTVWGNPHAGQGYDVVLLGGTGPLHISARTVEQRLARADHARVAASLQDVGFRSALDLVGAYAGRAEDLAPWLKDAQINRDRNLRLQYLAGLGLNAAEGGPIFSDILAYRKVPPDMFSSSAPGSTSTNRVPVQPRPK
jgi:spermidine synthase